MTDSGNERPRRAFAPEGAEPDGLDDTRRATPGGARRGAADDFGNPFARPADSDSETAIPAPVLPETEHRLDQPSGDAPRRSAPSTTSPSAVATASLPSRAQQRETEEDTGGWIRHHRKTLVMWGSGALAALILIVIGFFALANRGGGGAAQPPSESTTSELPPAATAANLMEASDASAIVEGVSWNVVDTIEAKKDRPRRPACLGKDVADINPVTSLHRSIGSDGQLALLHEIDSYASVDAATQIHAKRVSDLSTCAINQTYIASATAVTGLGDDAVQVTVVFEDEESPKYHTLLLVRTGRTASTFAVTQAGTPVEAAPLVTAAATRLAEICTASEGTCPADPTVTPSVPPKVDPPGWLISADLPRITPGYGRWLATGAPAELRLKGTSCENMSLDTDPGPTERMQITFVLSETSQIQVPDVFGLDELRFTFADEEAATSFESALVSNILSCKERLTTASVTEFEAVSGVGIDELPVSARMFSLSLDKTDDSKAYYQLIVTRAATTVSYVLVKVTPEYQFTEAQLGAIAIRTAQRASQA
ncbi:MAG: hypothetical protein Q4D96_08740 [Propionibacteriaceae bacterium]|nr:hypothetical protein [Propionibacteriaceae bacterium]